MKSVVDSKFEQELEQSSPISKKLSRLNSKEKNSIFEEVWKLLGWNS